MLKDIYDPLTEYVNLFRDKFKDVAERTFGELAQEAQVDIEANRETCRQIYQAESDLLSVKTSITRWTVVCVLLWIGVVAGIVVAFATDIVYFVEWMIALCAGEVLVLLSLFSKVHPRIKELKGERGRLSALIDSLKKRAWAQMSPLNRLYDWDILTRMMSQTVPKLEFDPYFTTQRLADLRMSYGWSDSFNEERSVIYSHSGLINGNPFVICRTRKMVMGSKTYTGTKTIHWTTRERGSDGKYHTVHHSETLTASVTAPYPEYPEMTRLIYGNVAAPDLIFTRKKSGLATKSGGLQYRLSRNHLRKKARNLKGADFAMMTNEEFETVFNTSDRNNNQQFALLFTPLAQESMIKLLKDQSVGYGDDFNFNKLKRINIIVSDHMQALDLEMNPQQYHRFDFDKAKVDFCKINADYFRAIYFCMAPLLCVPLYQQMRPQHDIYGYDMERRSAFWEHEALANFWGQNHFKHPECVTDCILKTEQHMLGGDSSKITVYAYGYRVVNRVTYIKKWGGDGRAHSVPVHWDEYLPVVGNGEIQLKEDNHTESPTTTHRQRLEHIDDVLSKSNLRIYRRHIASKV